MLLITGAEGQLGREVSKLYPNAIVANKSVLDITDYDQVQRFVGQHNIKTIVNCAAYIAVDAAESNEDIAKKINIDGCYNLAKSGACIVHISTDYVFDGMGFKPYEPNDETNPLSVYGKTKLDGEQVLLKEAETAVIVRTSWLYSVHKSNFLKTIMRIAKERESIQVVCDQIGSPTYAKDLAEAIYNIIPQINKNMKEIYHFSNEGVCSWYDFAKEIVDLSHIDCRVEAVLSDKYPTKAKRPFYSVLSKEKIKKDFNISVRHWKEGLVECLNQF